ncbi:MAG: glycosyltransferase [Actinomycetota bacterium]|nr:glycosyltransferase [Actinomycetota bacterium]
MQRPELSVVVASHDRPLRLRWLLNALAAQSLDPDRWEVVVGHDSAGPETEALLAEHPLARRGSLRSRGLPPGTAPPGANRNAALALARGTTIVFTDDDCRPPEGWLAAVIEASHHHAGAIIQGPVAPDPDEAVMLRSPFPRTQSFSAVPRPWAECANIIYPKALLERLGGFAQDMYTGEDTELSRRALAAGARIVGDERMLTYHAVEEGTAGDAVRGAPRWGDLALLIHRHPELRSELFLRVFWKREHALLLLAALGTGLSLRGGLDGGRRWRSPAGLLLALPWALQRNAHGRGVRGQARALVALPGWAAIDLAEIVVLARASRRHRALIL